ncbi:MAG: helix-turn-helix transcriptional regulator [Chlorobi bacterium]|nr:helix-turn-helix transcriptional regulator [Chlorobiota bacterium]
MLPEVAFGLVLRQLRLERGLTQADLEGDDIMERSYISRVESGRTQICLRGILHLAEKLQLTPAELMAAVSEKMHR